MLAEKGWGKGASTFVPVSALSNPERDERLTPTFQIADLTGQFCLFLGGLEFECFGNDLGEAVREAVRGNGGDDRRAGCDETFPGHAETCEGNATTPGRSALEGGSSAAFGCGARWRGWSGRDEILAAGQVKVISR